MIAFSIRKSNRARQLTLSVHPSGEVVVTVPADSSSRFSNLLNFGKTFEDRAQALVDKKRLWIHSKLKLFEKRREIWKQSGGLTVPKGNAQSYKDLKEQARTLATQKLAYFAAYYGPRHGIVPSGRIAIKNHSSRWGSCSALGNLNFNYRIVHLPPELQDYLIVHELCHLKEMNHSSHFWALVAEQIPNYRILRAKLAHALHV